MNEQVDSNSNYIYNSQQTNVGGVGITAGTPFYAAVEHPYNIQALLNTGGVSGGPQTMNSAYGKPLYYQAPRTIRLTARFTF